MIGAIALFFLVAAGLVLVVGTKKRASQFVGIAVAIALAGPLLVGLAAPLFKAIGPLLAIGAGALLLVGVVRGWLSYQAHRDGLRSRDERPSRKYRKEPWS